MSNRSRSKPAAPAFASPAPASNLLSFADVQRRLSLPSTPRPSWYALCTVSGTITTVEPQASALDHHDEVRNTWFGHASATRFPRGQQSESTTKIANPWPLSEHQSSLLQHHSSLRAMKYFCAYCVRLQLLLLDPWNNHDSGPPAGASWPSIICMLDLILYFTLGQLSLARQPGN